MQREDTEGREHTEARQLHLMAVYRKLKLLLMGGYRQVEVPLIPHIKGRDFYPNVAKVRKGIEIAYICRIWYVDSMFKPFNTNDGVDATSLS
jgi:hypothetical protein